MLRSGLTVFKTYCHQNQSFQHNPVDSRFCILTSETSINVVSLLRISSPEIFLFLDQKDPSSAADATIVFLNKRRLNCTNVITDGCLNVIQSTFVELSLLSLLWPKLHILAFILIGKTAILLEGPV